MHYDLIVIGMGLSGLMAAKAAVEADQKVLIIGKGMGSLTLFSNTIDVLGILPRTIKMNEGLSQWILDHPEHPYSKMGLEKIEGALTSFLSMFPPPYAFQKIEGGNCVIPTGAGTLRSTYLIPRTMVEGAAVDGRHTLIVGFKGFRDFYAHYVADQLRGRGINLRLPDPFYQELTATALARLMETKSFRQDIGREIKGQLCGETKLGFPALLGMHKPMEVKGDLEEIIGAKVFEIPMLPPSIPGMRIFNRFKEWLIQKGVTFLLGYAVSKATVNGKKCEKIEVSHPPVITSYSADCYILATGRFIGGGLVADEEKIFEPIFNLPVSQPKSREEWFGRYFLGDLPHPVHQAGILTDSSLRPINGRGELVYENVRVAGTMLADHHSTEERSREGIEIATGYMAAKHALEK
jgi:glycerol-3-phosphate dehydrogenase subunit B